MSTTECIALFLGVDLETAALYECILQNPRAVNELEGEYCDCSQRLEALKSMCLVAEWKDARHGSETIVTAMDPHYSLQAILLQDAWSRDASLHELSDIDTLPASDPLRGRYELLKAVTPLAQAAYSERVPYEGEDAYVVKGSDEIASAIALEISRATIEVKAMLCPPQLMGEVVWESINDRMNKGVRYTRLTEFEEVVRHGFAISKREITSGREELRILRNGFLPERFYVIDGILTAFFERNRRTGRYRKEVHFFKNEGVAERFLEVYSNASSSCVSLEELLPAIEAYREKLIERWTESYDENVVAWLTDLFDYGVFYSRERYDPAFIASSSAKCLIDRVVKRLSDGQLAIDYGFKDISNLNG